MCAWPPRPALGWRWFEHKQDDLQQVFAAQGLTDVAIRADTHMPPSDRTHWWRRQIIEAAQVAGHHANFLPFSGWSSLRLRVERWQLRYVASLHGVGRDSGVMAVTTFGEIEALVDAHGDEGPSPRDPIQTTKDAFRFVYTEGVDEIDRRGPELEALLDEGLAVALVKLLEKV